MTDLVIGGGVLGVKVEGPRRVLDVIRLPTSLKQVRYTSDEVTALCPVTGAPDQYVVRIELWARGYGIESKSLKLYLQSFRNEGIFCEAFADQIAKDVTAAMQCNAVVHVEQKPRGGVAIKASAFYLDVIPGDGALNEVDDG